MKISYKEYIEKAQKSTPQLYFDYLYRKLSHPITFLALRCGLTPNILSCLSIILSLIGGVVVFIGYPISGLIIFIFGYIFDFCDGNAARVVIKTTGMPEEKKKFGLLIENFNTNTSLLAMYFSLGYYFSLSSHSFWPLLLGFLVFGLKMTTRYTAYQSSAVLQKKESSSLVEMVVVVNKDLWQQIKFFLRKCLFSSNFYLAVYFLGFVLLNEKVIYLFLFYTVADGIMNLVRLLRILYKN